MQGCRGKDTSKKDADIRKASFRAIHRSTKGVTNRGMRLLPFFASFFIISKFVHKIFTISTYESLGLSDIIIRLDTILRYIYGKEMLPL